MSEPLGGGNEASVVCQGSADEGTPDVPSPPPSESLAVPEPREIANPITGELIRVDDPVSCAVAIAELRILEDRIKEVRRVLGSTLVTESFRLGSKTLHLPGAEVTLTEKKEIVWDLEKLAELRDLGLPEERWADLVRTTVEEKVNASVAKQIAGNNPDYRAVIEAARTDHVGDRYVSTVERAKT